MSNQSENELRKQDIKTIRKLIFDHSPNDIETRLRMAVTYIRADDEPLPKKVWTDLIQDIYKDELALHRQQGETERKKKNKPLLKQLELTARLEELEGLWDIPMFRRGTGKPAIKERIYALRKQLAALNKDGEKSTCIWGAKYSNAVFSCDKPATSGSYCEEHKPKDGEGK